MSHRVKASVYYLSQILLVVLAVATGSPARADDSVAQVAPHSVSSLTTISAVPPGA